MLTEEEALNKRIEDIYAEYLSWKDVVEATYGERMTITRQDVRNYLELRELKEILAE